MIKFLPAIALLLLAVSRLPAQTTETFTYNPNQPIPDNSTLGVTDAQIVASAITTITSISVRLVITGGFDGDFYAFLEHSSGFSVLLNRTGRTSTNNLGSSATGFDVTFDDVAPNGDIHMAPGVAGAPITGLWQPDGRNVNPNIALDTSPRSAFLASFNGLDANGEWRLFIADVSPISAGTFATWELQITGIPEPSTLALGAIGLMAMIGCALRSRKGSNRRG